MWRSRCRSFANQVLLNPLFTSIVDRIVPAPNLGKKGERIAERLLLKKGMYVVARSYSSSLGEIDLIAVDHRTVVFVEVKTRNSCLAGSPVEAVDETKQRKISGVAKQYIQRHGLHEIRCRFDVVAIELQQGGQSPKIDYFENAFEFCDEPVVP